MKNTFVLFALFLISCGGGGSLPPFEYKDNSRIVIEGILLDQDGHPLPNQSVNLAFTKYQTEIVKNVVSDSNGYFFMSVPKSNYNYYLILDNKDIISIENYSSLLTVDSQNSPLFYGTIGNLNATYYNFGNIKLISI